MEQLYTWRLFLGDMSDYSETVCASMFGGVWLEEKGALRPRKTQVRETHVPFGEVLIKQSTRAT